MYGRGCYDGFPPIPKQTRSTMTAGPDQPYTILQLTHLKRIGDICHRMVWPAQEIARRMPAWRVVNLTAEAEEHYRWAEAADLLVLSQSLDLDLLPVIERRHRKGLKTLVEYVDNFYDIPPASNAAGRLSTPLACQAYELILEACDAVIVTGPGLQRLLSGLCDVIENHWPQPLPSFESVWRAPGETFVVGWGGSAGHMADILAILPLLRRLAREEPRLRVHLMGDEALARYARIPPAQFHHRGWGDMEAYFQFLDGLHLGVVPLLDTPFNRCRSDIKAVEMIARGVLPLLPALPSYEGLLAAAGLEPYTDQQALARRIRFYLHHPEVLREEARRLHEYVRRERVITQRHERLELYRRMLPPRPGGEYWGLAPGYHEIPGTPMQETPSGRLLRRWAQVPPEHLPAALAEVSRAARHNPRHPDLALLELRLAQRAGRADWWERLAAARRRFPRDLRFELLALRSAPGENAPERDPERDLEPMWERLRQRLEALPPAHRDFYERDIVALLCQQLPQRPALAAVAERLLECYPAALPLRQQLALLYESLDEHARALHHFRELARAKRIWSKNAAYLTQVREDWLETWRLALAARVGEGNDPSDPA